MRGEETFPFDGWDLAMVGRSLGGEALGSWAGTLGSWTATFGAELAGWTATFGFVAGIFGPTGDLVGAALGGPLGAWTESLG